MTMEKGIALSQLAFTGDLSYVDRKPLK